MRSPPILRPMIESASRSPNWQPQSDSSLRRPHGPPRSVHAQRNRARPGLLTARRRGGAAARAFFTRALTHGPSPVEVTTDRAPVYPRVIDDLAPAARHVTEQYANNRVEADHARLKARLRPMRGLKTISSLRVISVGHAFVQNLRLGHYQLTADVPVHDRVRLAFAELASCL